MTRRTVRTLRITALSAALVGGTAFALVGVPSLTAAGAATINPTPGTATFDGQPINLSEGWGSAHACLVEGPSEVQCFATSAELNASLVGTKSSAVDSPATSCGGGALYLFKGENYSGNELAIESYGFWVNLSDYGFAGAVGSWDNASSCDAFAATGTYGSGSLLSMPSFNYSATMPAPWSSNTESAEVS